MARNDEHDPIGEYVRRIGELTMSVMGPAISMRPSITCPRCGLTSYHHEDIRNRYCGACHRFEGETDHHAFLESSEPTRNLEASRDEQQEQEDRH
jgi:ribosomal protein S27AE